MTKLIFYVLVRKQTPGNPRDCVFLLMIEASSPAFVVVDPNEMNLGKNRFFQGDEVSALTASMARENSCRQISSSFFKTARKKRHNIRPNY